MSTSKQIQDLTLYSSIGDNDLFVSVPLGTGDAKAVKAQSFLAYIHGYFPYTSDIYTASQSDAKYALIGDATTDYTALSNIPTIEGVSVTGVLTANDLALLKNTLEVNGISAVDVAGIPTITLSASDVGAASSTHASTHASGQSDELTPANIGAVTASGGEAGNTVCTFTTAGVRTAITTGATLATIFGKIAKYEEDFGTAAFKSVGTASSDVAAGVHASTHESGSTDPIKVGTTASLPVFTGTGGVLVAKSVSDALNTLKGVSYLATSAITSASDLNALTTALSYISTSTTNSSSLFALLGGTNALIFQYTDTALGVRQVAYSSSSNKVATRYYVSSAWGSWSTIYTSASSIPNTITSGGSNSFSSSSGSGTVVTHGFGSIATSLYFVSVTPSASGGGNIGEIYVTKNADGTFTVFNTGSATTSFDWIVTKP